MARCRWRTVIFLWRFFVAFLDFIFLFFLEKEASKWMLNDRRDEPLRSSNCWW